jgi:hypothetical protein
MQLCDVLKDFNTKNGLKLQKKKYSVPELSPQRKKEVFGQM